MKKLNFYERAEKLGHSADLLKSGNVISTVITVSNVDELKKLLDDNSSCDERVENEKALFGHIPITDESDVSDRAIIRRVNAYVYGHRELANSDRKIINGAFPIEVNTVSAANITYDKPTDLGTSIPLVILNYGTVTMNDGACANINNSQLEYTMDTLIRSGAPPSGLGDFNILGVAGSAGVKVGTGTNQGKSTNGSEGNCSSCGIASDSGGTGDPGKSGGPGPKGNPGFDGLPSKPAVFNITKDVQSASKVIFFSMSGQGGQGGTGGKGGKGGDGGNGGKGATCSATGSAGGNGGAGGPGGPGGIGGPGGNGVNAADGAIIINVAAASIDKIAQATNDALPGEGGVGGAGGAGGTGGTGGTGGPYNGNGTKGDPGGTVGNATSGSRGTGTGKATVPQIRPI